MSEIEPVDTVDVRDMVCSRPLITAVKAIAPLKKGDVLKVLCDADLEGSLTRIFCKVRKHELVRREEGEYIVLYNRK